MANPCHVVLILKAVESAGRIDEQPTGTQTRPDVGHNLALQLIAFLYVLRTPLPYRLRILTKHAFARTGYISEYDIKHEWCTGVVGCVVVSDDNTGRSKLDDILLQYLGARAQGFVAHQLAARWQGREGTSGLATGSGTKVEHADRLVHETAQHMVEKHA